MARQTEKIIHLGIVALGHQYNRERKSKFEKFDEALGPVCTF
jgi:hypothetical protein